MTSKHKEHVLNEGHKFINNMDENNNEPGLTKVNTNYHEKELTPTDYFVKS